MIKYLIIFLSLSFLTLSAFAPAGEVVNYYGIGPKLVFNTTNYELSWSAHPNSIYYKQEYLPANETSEHFNDMVLIDFLHTDLSLKDAVAAQINKITERKKTDAVCNYKLNEGPDGTEYILDFLMSESKGDNLNLLEWSAYHYKAYTDAAGHKGILLFGICHRAYEDQTGIFLKGLANYRTQHINALISYPLPNIQIK